MAAGGKGDSVFLDIVIYGMKVFSEKADNLIRELSVLMDYHEIIEFRDDLDRIRFSKPLELNDFEEKLEMKKADLLSRASERGYDLQRLQEEMERRSNTKSI